MPTINDKHYVTSTGMQLLRHELKSLIKTERPKILEVVSWAAGNGDRSENGDYIYGKKRLREIDKRVRYLTKRIENAVVVDPARQQAQEKVFFGATVTYQTEDELQFTVKIVGLDEADIKQNKISYISPLAKALIKSNVGQTIEFCAPEGTKVLELIDIKYERA